MVDVELLLSDNGGVRIYPTEWHNTIYFGYQKNANITPGFYQQSYPGTSNTPFSSGYHYWNMMVVTVTGSWV